MAPADPRWHQCLSPFRRLSPSSRRSMSLFLADLRCHVGEEGFLRVAINNRWVLHGGRRFRDPFRYPSPPRGLKGEKQPRAAVTAELRGIYVTSRAEISSYCLPVGHPGVRFASHPRGTLTRRGSRNNIPGSAPHTYLALTTKPSRVKALRALTELNCLRVLVTRRRPLPWSTGH